MATILNIVQILLLVMIIPVFILVIVALIQATRKQVKNNKKLKSNLEHGAVDLEQQIMFLEAYGGRNNILNTNLEQSRITVKVKDVDKVDVFQLQSLGASNVLITQTNVKCSFQERAPFVYKLLQ